MENNKSIESIISLIAKTGLFFANADGTYDARERKFIDRFIKKLEKLGPVDHVRPLLEGTLQEAYTLDEIVAETKDLLKNFNKVEQSAIKMTLEEYVDDVIGADYVANKAERKTFAAWKKAIEIE